MRDKAAYDIQYAKEHITRKSVTFNDVHEEDRELLAYVNGLNEVFVAYVKRLIREDMRRKGK